MKTSTNKVILFILLGLLSFYIGLDMHLINSGVTLALLRIVVLGQGVSFLCIGLMGILIKREIITLLKQLSNLIEQMTRYEPEEVFSPLKDELTSKLQVQVTRLGKILRTRHKQVQDEKEQIQQLISDIAHQLKTPLSNVSLYTEFIKEQYGVDELELYKGLEGEVDKLRFLTEGFIKMSRLEGGLIKLKIEEVDLKDTCLSAIKQAYFQAINKPIEIVFEQAPSLVIKHDRKWTTEALYNVLDNAIKYSKPYTKVQVKLIPYELFVRIDVKDEGMGIPVEEVNEIFQRFYRGEQAQFYEGVGIGLYLTRKIIIEQGGYIKVESKRGVGSTFSIFLPQ